MENRPTTIKAGFAETIALAPGQCIDVISPTGCQVADVWAFSASDPSEHMSMEHSRLHMGRIAPQQGSTLVTDRRRPILTLVVDETPGTHDTLLAACDPERYELLGHDGYHRNCRDNFREALNAIGIRPSHVPAPLNLFENAPVQSNGSIAIEPPESRPGAYVRLRAEMDALLVISACPQDMVPTNGAGCSPGGLEYRILTHE